MKSNWMLVGLCFGLTACGGSDDAGEDRASLPVQPEMVETPIAQLEDADLLRVCRAAHGHSVGRDPSSVDASIEQAGIARLSYTRDDGRSFQYDCKVLGNFVRTRMIDEAGPGTGPGAWSGRGSTLTFELRGSQIVIREVFFDGSSDVGSYEL